MSKIVLFLFFLFFLSCQAKGDEDKVSKEEFRKMYKKRMKELRKLEK